MEMQMTSRNMQTAEEGVIAGHKTEHALGGVKSSYNFWDIPIISENLSKNCLKTIPNQKPIRTRAIAACGRKTVLQNRSVFLRAKIRGAARSGCKNER